jgi:hypothetical protein
LKASLEGISTTLFYDINDLFIVGYILHGLSSSSAFTLMFIHLPINPPTEEACQRGQVG